MSRSNANVLDAVVIGAGPAGLNAALVLGRSRRRVLVLDAGEPRNAASHAMHGFLSRDGLDPAELRRIGRDQLQMYPDVHVTAASAEQVRPTAEGFEVLASGRRVVARKVVLAVGVADALPTIEGLASLYGQGVFHCPYCDAWEVRDQPLAVFSEGPDGFRLAMLLRQWSPDLVFCTHGPAGLRAEERARLAELGIGLREERVARLDGAGGRLERIVFEDASSIGRRALFFHAPARISSSLPEALGCALTDTGRIQVDEAGRTSVPGVYAAGDAARRSGQHPASQVIFAAASGSLAAIALHHELLFEDVGLAPALPPVTLANVPV